MSEIPAISVVVPVRDEAENIDPLIDEITRALAGEAHEIIYVDDGSRDDTAARLEAALRRVPTLRVATHARSAGQSAALWTGVSAARAALVATLDGDGQNDPADLPALITLAREAQARGELALVAGQRLKRRDSAVKRASSRIANAIRAAALGDRTPDTGCGLKVFPRALYVSLPRFDHMHRFLPALALREGANVIRCPVNHRPRRAGRSKYGTLHRAAVGLVDLLGVMWLKRRRIDPALKRAP